MNFKFIASCHDFKGFILTSCTPYISTNMQLANTLTKGLVNNFFQDITSKLGINRFIR